MGTEQRDFWSAVARKYDTVVDRQIGPATRSLVRDRVAREGPLGALAEFGCGTGYFTQALAARATNVVATDLSPGMLTLAEERTGAANVKFQLEDCQRTSFTAGTFDTAFLCLVIHFTEPARTLAEMYRILKPGGMLIVVNLDPGALRPFDRVRSVIRILYRGLLGYRTKPPKGFGTNVLTERTLCGLLAGSGFSVTDTETISDPSRTSNIPVEYVRAVKV